VVGIFRTSVNLAAAYGIAVTSTMVVTSIFLFFVLRDRLRRPIGCRDHRRVVPRDRLVFFSANALKLASGGWFPLILAVAIVIVMTTWATGRRLLTARLRERSSTFEQIARCTVRAAGDLATHRRLPVARARSRPPALWRLVHRLNVRPERCILVQVATEARPKVPHAERFDVQPVTEASIAWPCGTASWKSPTFPP
jgi:KUP system potassium uptake protein